jgi:hypothetical protein
VFVDRLGASPPQGDLFLRPEPGALRKTEAPAVRWCHERLARWRTDESWD